MDGSLLCLENVNSDGEMKEQRGDRRGKHTTRQGGRGDTQDKHSETDNDETKGPQERRDHTV